MAKKDPEPQDPRILQHFKRGAEIQMISRLLKTSGVAKDTERPKTGQPWKAKMN